LTVQRNPENTGVIVGVVLIVVGIAMMVVPGLAGMDGMNGGYALGFAGMFLIIVGLIVAAVYWRRAATARHILAGENQIVYWTYEPDEWRRYAEQEFALDVREKRGLYWLVVAIMVVIGLVFIIADPEAGIWVAAVLAGVAVLLAFFAFVMPRLAHRRRLRVPGEAIIAAEGVYLAGSLHVWRQLGSQLTRVSIVGENPAMIEFQIEAPTQTGTQVYPVRVPIPRGQEAMAQQVVAHFSIS
jgi:F0F1-type ATP synthase assembly protein I